MKPFMYENKKIVREEETDLIPSTAITIAVDTAYVASVSAQAQPVTQGVYMMDNQLANGSTGEANLELHTICDAGSLIGFHAVPINQLGSSGDKVEITGFTVSNGSVFTANGQPVMQNDSSGQPDPTYWIGQAINEGTQTYQIQLLVTTGQLHPTAYPVNWDPFITAR